VREAKSKTSERPAVAGRAVESGRRSVSAFSGRKEDARRETSASALDQVIHERMRLGIISALAVNESLTFSALKRLLEASDGNLSVHARKLEDASYIVCTKSFEERVPRTEYRITAQGRRALERYLEQMEQIIHQARGS
jgi:DNA-binding HxlR family transcriptional regulator